MLENFTEKDDKQFARLVGLIFLLANIILGFLAVGLMYILAISKHV